MNSCCIADGGHGREVKESEIGEASGMGQTGNGAESGVCGGGKPLRFFIFKDNE